MEDRATTINDKASETGLSCLSRSCPSGRLAYLLRFLLSRQGSVSAEVSRYLDLEVFRDGDPRGSEFFGDSGALLLRQGFTFAIPEFIRSIHLAIQNAIKGPKHT